MPIARSAIFVDFDNVFSSLIEEDPAAALIFAEAPDRWLSTLANSHTTVGPRAWLVRRCYMNPAGFVVDPAAAAHTEDDRRKARIFFSRFRPFFTKAGFEVVDCPSLTRRNKNAADIRIALDVNDALAAHTTYDEFVLASGDSDFTPVLVRLRAADRRTVIMSPSIIAKAYAGVADLHLDSEAIRDVLGVEWDDSELSGPAPSEVEQTHMHGPEEDLTRVCCTNG